MGVIDLYPHTLDYALHALQSLYPVRADIEIGTLIECNEAAAKMTGYERG